MPNKPQRPKPSHHKRQAPQPTRSTSAMPLEIIGMEGGYGVGRQGKQRVLVPYTIEGEQVMASTVVQEGQTIYAQGQSFRAISGDRIQGECEHFGSCWGCQWQHIAYSAQLLIKFDLIAQTLQHVGGFTDEELEKTLQPVIPSPQEWSYHHQATFHRLRDGRYGFPRNTTFKKGFEAIENCLTLHEDLQLLHESLDINFEELERYSLIRGSDGETMMVFNMKTEDMPELETDLPTSVNVVLADGEPVNLFGNSSVRYLVDGRWFRVTAGAFFRSNVAQVENLVKEVMFALSLKGGESVLDLYAGVGVFSAFIAPIADVVTLVESYPPSVTDADENLAEFDNLDVVEGTVEEILDDMIDNEARYDAVVVDPLMRGMSDGDMERLLKLNIPRVVYVSGNPHSFAQNARTLIVAGYELKRIQPLDAAPHTFYADLVALFTKTV